jgi:diguanylate cyclase (GGDEF)-like protein/PAS domain S-box-containing protein
LAAENALLENEARLRAILNAVPAGVVLVDVENQLITDLNPIAAEMLGGTREDIIGANCQQHICAARQGECPLAANGQQVHQVECRLTGAQGAQTPVIKRVAPVTIGSRRYFVECLVDISERRQAEKALKRERDFSDALVDTVGSLVVVLDRSGNIIRFNRACEQATGYVAEEVVGKPFWDLFLPAEDVPLVREAFSTLDAAQFPNGEENHWRTRDGQSRRIAWSNTALLDQQGSLEYVIATGLDITERCSAQEALQESEERFRRLAENALDLIYRIRLVPEPVFEYVSPSSTAIVGYTPEEHYTDPLLGMKIVHPLDRPLLKAALTNPDLMTKPTVTRWLHKDGSVVWIEQRNSVIRDAQGNVVALEGIARDVSERVRAELALKDTNEELKSLVTKLETRNEESQLMGEMTELLQLARGSEEAYSVIAKTASHLFGQDAGALYVLSASRNLLQATATWNGYPAGERTMGPDDCWALRRGRAHAFEPESLTPPCHHAQGVEHPYLCLPLVAQGDTLGVLHIRLRPGTRVSERERLALSLADRVGLALANLHLRQSLRDQAIRDPLTGLFNRRYLEETLEREIRRAARRGQPLGVVMVDVDHFKCFNDVSGHEAGDAVLSALGTYFRSHVRQEDIACRYGGEEFALILPEASLEATAQRADGIRAGIAALRVAHRQRTLGPVTVSMGVAAWPEHGENGEALIRAADAALYSAKSQGRNRIVAAGHPVRIRSDQTS